MQLTINLNHVSKVLGWFLSSGHIKLAEKKGLSIDFLWYNVYGFACYSVFNLSFFISEKIRQEYRDHNDGKDNLVQMNDVVFALHALLLSSITLLQTYFYKRDANQKVSSVALSVILASTFGAILLFAGVLSGINQWIDLLYFISYIKLGLSFIKYVPQLYLNFERKSTIGWSIHNIILDFTGGMLSIVQLALDAYATNNWNGILGYPVKLGLGFLSMTFDILFMTQHYILYRTSGDRKCYSKSIDCIDDVDIVEEEDVQN
ncbi:4791_t:CDS:2, partial [Acaulospora morrowiae]